MLDKICGRSRCRLIELLNIRRYSHSIRRNQTLWGFSVRFCGIVEMLIDDVGLCSKIDDVRGQIRVVPISTQRVHMEDLKNYPEGYRYQETCTVRLGILQKKYKK